MRILTVGRRAVLVEVEDALAAAALAAHARASSLAADDIVPAARTVLFDGVEPDDVADLVAGWQRGEEDLPRGPVVSIPTAYDGPDLHRVAELWGCSVDELVRRHTGVEFVSVFGGFAPGFSYLAGLPADWAVPRLESPRPRIRAGSVALADTWCAVYPSDSPGGWLILGTTQVALWDVSREPASLLAPGTRVRFEQVRR